MLGDIVFEKGRTTQEKSELVDEQKAESVDRFGRWSIDLTCQTITWSQEFANIAGRADLAGQKVDLEQHIACYHPSEQEFVRMAIRAGGAGLALGSDEFTRRHRIIRPSGEERDVVLHGHTQRDEHGAIIGISGISLDISDLTYFERGLQASEALLKNTMENMDQGLVHFDANGCVRVFNQRAGTMLDLPPAALHVGAAFKDLHELLVARGAFDSLDAAARTEIDRQRLAGLPHSFEVTLKTVTIEVRYTPLPEGGAVCTYTDISVRCEAEEAVRRSEQRFRLITDNVNDVIVFADLDVRCVYISPSVQSVLGYEATKFIGTRPVDWMHPDDMYSQVHTIKKLLEEADDAIVTTKRYRHRDGHFLWMETSTRLVIDALDGQPTGFVATLRDVTARKEAEEQVRYLALTDALTGLSNRTLFQDRLERTIVHTTRSGRSFAVLACDLDRFKAVNDSLGHPAGDRLLQIIASRIKTTLRPYDTVARLGGDEFAVILTDLASPCIASQLAGKLIEAVSAPIYLDDRKVEVGMSVGLTVASGDAVKAEELFKRADIALYEAKAAGRSTYREFCPDAVARAMSRGQLGLDMKEAIQRCQFRLVYQPVVDGRTGAVDGFEALMRWEHPQRGEIAPSEFIPLAEENGLIVPLGAWALLEACREASHWPQQIRVAVNVSPVQLRNDELEAAVTAALSASGLSADRLKLEVTENVLMLDTDAVLARLHRLKAIGLHIALDDFGIGYSSLNYLRRFPFDTLKIDRAFIQEIADPDAAAIIRAVVGLGERLGMSIVAEGVETQEQLDLVRQEGCHVVQGFLFSPPLPPNVARIYAEQHAA